MTQQTNIQPSDVDDFLLHVLTLNPTTLNCLNPQVSLPHRPAASFHSTSPPSSVSRLVLGSRQRGQHLHLRRVAASAGVRQLSAQLARVQALSEHAEEMAHQPSPKTQRRRHGQGGAPGPQAGGKASPSVHPQPQPGTGQPAQVGRHAHHPARHPQGTGER